MNNPVYGAKFKAYLLTICRLGIAFAMNIKDCNCELLPPLNHS